MRRYKPQNKTRILDSILQIPSSLWPVSLNELTDKDKKQSEVNRKKNKQLNIVGSGLVDYICVLENNIEKLKINGV